MNRNGNMNAILGDYLPEVYPGQNSKYQQELMDRQFPDVTPEMVEAIAQKLKQQGHHELAAGIGKTLGTIGLGAGTGITAAGSPLLGLPIAAAGGYMMSEGANNDRLAGQRRAERADLQAKAYPGHLGSF